MSGFSVKVPAIVATGVICLAVGVALGVFGTTFFGYQIGQPASVGAPPPADGGPPGGMPGMPGGGGKMPGMGGRGPSPKNQLASLVTKLDLLSQKPLAVNLSEEQKKKVREQLQGLDAKEDLSDEDAKTRLDALLDVLKDQKETLEAAGYRWPGQGGFQRPPSAPNPFMLEKNSDALKALQKRLSGPAGK